MKIIQRLRTLLRMESLEERNLPCATVRPVAEPTVFTARVALPQAAPRSDAIDLRRGSFAPPAARGSRFDAVAMDTGSRWQVGQVDFSGCFGEPETATPVGRIGNNYLQLLACSAPTVSALAWL